MDIWTKQVPARRFAQPAELKGVGQIELIDFEITNANRRVRSTCSLLAMRART